MEGSKISVRFFLFCVFSTMVNNSLEEFVSSNLFDLNNVNEWIPVVVETLQRICIKKYIRMIFFILIY